MKYLSLFPSDGGGTSSGSNSLFGKIDPPTGLFSGDPAAAAGSLLTLGIRLFFIFSGVTALIYMLRGSFDWITSGGEKEKISAAQQRIFNAIVGILLLVAVLAIVATLEQLVFKRTFCFGLTCAIELPRAGQ
jgi:hypothetical protein